MTQSNASPLLLQRLLTWLNVKIRKYKIPLFLSYLFGFLAYGFQFTNKLLNHDEAYNLFGKGGTYDLGRWGIEICRIVFPDFSMPWIYGILSLTLVAIGICLIVDIFQIRSRLLQGILCGIVITFPSLTSVFVFMFTSAPYAVAILTSILAVWLLTSHVKGRVPLAGLCMVFSLSIYQAYLTLSAGILVLLLIQMLLQGEELKTVFRRGVSYLLFLLSCMVIYYLLTKLIFLLRGSGFSTYAKNGADISLRDIPARILTTYDYFRRMLYWSNLSIAPTAFSTSIHTHLVRLIVVLLVLCCLVRRAWQPLRLLFLGAMVAILPLACNCMYLLSDPLFLHTLMVYGFVCLYLLAIILADLLLRGNVPGKLLSLVKRVSTALVPLFLACILITNVYTANEASLYQHLQYENIVSFYTSLEAYLTATPQFTESTRLALIGQYNPAQKQYPVFVQVLNGVDSVYPTMYSAPQFLQYYLGFSIPFASSQEKAVIAQTEQFAQMPCYPYYGSMAFFGDTLVVKLSE